jgi:hypothetical protein
MLHLQRKVEVKGQLLLHVVHVAGMRMIGKVLVEVQEETYLREPWRGAW